MKHWEISGNLDDELTGIENYATFESGICKVKSLYDQVFGLDTMNRIDFLVDNATGGSGYTPIATPVLNKLVVIKLRISPKDNEATVAYQFAHELTHVVFRAYFGMNKPKANDQEESICSAASLIVVKKLYPDIFPVYKKYVEALKISAYRNGATLADGLNYDIEKLKCLIADFSYDTLSSG